MNYLSEINEFHKRCLYNPVSARAIAFWFILMHYANSARWHFPLVIRESKIRGDLGLNHEQFIIARKELVDGEYIIHEVQSGNRPAKYRIVSRGSLTNRGDIQ